ncbi:hypothetical protein [Micromonospora sp. C95]|uniref:hypothetical protein n=1 Tax=Micromonospora sp. C95 TaxID=2824882 RepID=UPI001B38851F|nr:hypothetical protein [Micromonospora sp. C95]MBQ1023973.1 hypothetical protein [Micromonospora sp. C95]
MGRDEDHVSRSVDCFDRTGRRLFILGVLLLVMLGLVAVPLALAVHTGLPALIEKSGGGPLLAGTLASLGVAVAGIFSGAGRMLRAIPAILQARNDHPALPTKDGRLLKSNTDKLGIGAGVRR